MQSDPSKLNAMDPSPLGTSVWQWYNSRTLVELVAFIKLAKKHYLYANTNKTNDNAQIPNNQAYIYNHMNQLLFPNNQPNYNYCENDDTTESNIKRRRLCNGSIDVCTKEINTNFETLNNMSKCNKSQLLNALFNVFTQDQLEQIKTRYGFLVLYKQRQRNRAKYIIKRLFYIFKQWIQRCGFQQSFYCYVPAFSHRTQYFYLCWQSEYVLVAEYHNRSIPFSNNYHRNRNNYMNNNNSNNISNNISNNTSNNMTNNISNNTNNNSNIGTTHTMPNTYGYNNRTNNNNNNNTNNTNAFDNHPLNTTTTLWDAAKRRTTITLEFCPDYIPPQGTIIHNMHGWWKLQNKNGKCIYVNIDYSDAVYEYIYRNSFHGLQVEAKWIHNCNNLNLVGGVSCTNINVQADLMLSSSVSLQLQQFCGKNACKTLEFQLLPQYFDQQYRYTYDNCSGLSNSNTRIKCNQMFSGRINTIFSCSCSNLHFANVALQEQEQEYHLPVKVCGSIDRSGHILFHHSTSTASLGTAVVNPTFTSNIAQPHYHQSFHFNYCQVSRTVILEADITPFIQQDLECVEWNNFVFTGAIFQYTPIIKIVQEYIGG